MLCKGREAPFSPTVEDPLSLLEMCTSLSMSPSRDGDSVAALVLPHEMGRAGRAALRWNQASPSAFRFLSFPSLEPVCVPTLAQQTMSSAVTQS